MTFPFPVPSTVPLFLAPMAGVSDHPFRRMCRSFGADVVTSQFLSSEGIRRGVESVQNGASFTPDERPIGIQLYGAEPTALAEAAALVTEQYRPDFIDVNFGCPARRVVRHNGGAACLKDLSLVERIVRAVRGATCLPVAVKTRSGWDESTRNPVEIALRCQDAGAQMLTLHPRTRAQMYHGAARWEEIAAVVEALEIPIVGNGDIRSADDAVRMRRETRCAGLMIARGCLGNPWIFRETRDLLSGRDPAPRPGAAERFAVMLRHRDLVRDGHVDDRRSAFEFRKHLGWYSKGLPNAAQLRVQLFGIESLDSVETVLDRYRTPVEKIA